MATLRIGTRGSRLALTQTGWVADALRATDGGLDVEIVEIKTTGDIRQDVPLGPALGTSFFTKEIEQALLDDRIDLAVHSSKDLASRMPAGLVLAAIPLREDPRDVLVTRGATLAELPRGATVGTSSPRRRGFLALARPDLELRDQRGNVPTRVAAVDEGRVDAVVLAAAGLARLDLSERVSEHLDTELVIPAAGQGALAIQIRTDDPHVAGLVAPLDHGPTSRAVRAERACLRRLEAGCQAPIGVLARLDGEEVRAMAAILAPGGRVDASASGPAADPEALGERIAEEMLSSLGLPSLAGVSWAGPPARDTEAPV